MSGLPIDDTDRRIIQLLRQDARITIAQIGREVSMSQPSVKERIAKLEEKGILSGYTAILGMSGLDRGTMAFVLLNTERCNELVDFCLASSVEALTAFQERLAVFGPSKLHVRLKNILAA